MKRRATAGSISTPAQLRHLRDKEGSTPPGSLRFIPLPIQCPQETLDPKATDPPLMIHSQAAPWSHTEASHGILWPVI